MQSFDSLQPFDALHLSTVLLMAVLFFGVFFLFRKRSRRTKYIVLGILMGINLIQHLFKFWFWPHMRTGKFGLTETAYNVCAFLILLCPYAVFGKNNLIKQFQFYVGAFAGFCAPFYPMWFFGGSIFTWEYLRAYTCHVLLLLTSVLPGMWGLIEFRMRDGWKFGLCALAALSLILANNALVYTLLGVKQDALINTLYGYNPVFMMGPPAGEHIVRTILVPLTPPFFRLENGRYLPILWYAIPLYTVFTALGYAFGAGLEHLQKRKQPSEEVQK